MAIPTLRELASSWQISWPCPQGSKAGHPCYTAALLQGRTSNTSVPQSTGCEAVLVLRWLLCNLSHLHPPGGNSASTSVHCSSAQLVLLKELITAALYYSVFLNFKHRLYFFSKYSAFCKLSKNPLFFHIQMIST